MKTTFNTNKTLSNILLILVSVALLANCENTPVQPNQQGQTNSQTHPEPIIITESPNHSSSNSGTEPQKQEAHQDAPNTDAAPLQTLQTLGNWGLKDCQELAKPELNKYLAKCRDLSGVVLTKDMGSRENYINKCLASVFDFVLSINTKCNTWVKDFDVTYESFEWSKPQSESWIKSTSRKAKGYCKSLMSTIRFINACGATAYYNDCISSFNFWFKYVAGVRKSSLKVPLMPVTPECDKDCAKKAVDQIMESEGKCIERNTPKDAMVCQKYSVRDECRAVSDRKAKKWTVRCNAEVSLLRTMDIAPEDCAMCSEGANKVLQDCFNHETLPFDSKCDLWIVTDNQNKCFKKNFDYFSGICGSSELHWIKTSIGKRPKKCVDFTPKQCEDRARKIIDQNFNHCISHADSLTDPCEAFRARLGCWTTQHKEAELWSTFCGVHIPYPMILARPPPGCDGNSGSTPKPPVKDDDHEHHEHHFGFDTVEDHHFTLHAFTITNLCEWRAKDEIDSEFMTCEFVAEHFLSSCQRWSAHSKCYAERSERAAKWEKKCGLKFSYEAPKIACPLKCNNDQDLTCAAKATTKIDAQVATCKKQTETMKFSNKCGEVNHKNTCVLEGLKSQIQKYKQCNWDWVSFNKEINLDKECHVESCLDTARTYMNLISQSCKDSVANSKMNECAKARAVNSCLKSYQLVVDYFNDTCPEKNLLMFALEDESLVCAQESTPAVSSTTASQ